MPILLIPPAQSFTATVDLAPGAAELALTARFGFTGTVAVAPPAATLDITARMGYNATVALESAPASLSIRARRQKRGGHEWEDLSGYSRFVSSGPKILEELGQPVAPTGAQPVQLSVPPLNVPFAPLLERALRILAQPKPPAAAAPAPAPPPAVVASTAPVAMTPERVKDIRLQDEKLLEQFLLSQLLDVA